MLAPVILLLVLSATLPTKKVGADKERATIFEFGTVPQKSLPASFKNQYRMEFVLIPAGKFTMGSADGTDDEKPAHEVNITQAFYLTRYEVTQWQWQAAMATTVEVQRRKLQGPRDLAGPRKAGEGGERPIYYVSWQEAHAFVQKLNALHDGHTYRLPSEAEWEYACRAGSSGERPADLYAIAWYKTNSYDLTQPVGMRRANAFGLCDMIGNVSEWCEDSSHRNYNGAPTDGSAWSTAGEVDLRIVRGGSFFTGNLDYLRCGARSALAPDHSDFETGFRVVATTRSE